METSEQLVRSKLTEMERRKTREYVAANPELGKEMEGLRAGLYASVKTALREIGNLDAEIEKKVMEDPTMKDVADAISLEVVYQSAELRYDGALGEKDTILVAKLSELIERRGPDYALRDETINEAKRQVIPLLDDYRKRKEDKRKWAEASIETICSKFGAEFDAAAGQAKNDAEKAMINAQSAAITKTLKSYLGILVKVVDELREQEIRELYKLDLERERVLRAAINANRATAYSGK